MRTPTPAAARNAALARDGHACRYPGCGRTADYLTRLRDRLLRLARRKPKALWGTAYAPGLLRRYNIGPRTTMLEVDHIVEQADGGGHELANLQTLCVFCHAGKTAVRIHARARTPKKVPGLGRVSGRERAVEAFSSFSPRTIPTPRPGTPATPAAPRRGARRNYTEAEFLAAARRREAAIGEEACKM